MNEMASESAALSVIGVTHRYRRSRGLSLGPLDVRIDRPGITGLVGPNGAGKSTLLKMWAGLERPLTGTATVGALDPWHQRPAAAQKIGYVPQVPALYGSLSVEQHLAFAVLERPSFNVDASRALLTEMRVPVSARGNELSGGQRAQVAMAIALGTGAPTLLLDEPLASLDPLVRRDFLELLTNAVAERGSIAVLSSHVVTDIEQACSRLIVLGHGRELIHGEIKELLLTHRKCPPHSSLPPDWEAVTTFSGRDGKSDLVRLRPGSRLPSEEVGSAASLEDIVVGYLTIGRRDE
jgi:ABC-2 type transport system ATP-binding protein